MNRLLAFWVSLVIAFLPLATLAGYVVSRLAWSFNRATGKRRRARRTRKAPPGLPRPTAPNRLRTVKRSGSQPKRAA